MEIRRHGGGRPRKQKTGNRNLKSTTEFIDWLVLQRKSTKQPLWEVLESIKNEIETYRKKAVSLNQEKIDSVIAIPKLINVQHRQALDISILEDQLFAKHKEPLVIIAK